MLVVPAVSPVTTPDVRLILATPVAELVHAPPLEVVVIALEEPWHICEAPVINAGIALTDTATDLLQPAGSIYVINAEPAPIPVTTPVAGSTEATVAALDVQPPPVTVFASVVVCPWHITVPPITVIAAGIGFTVTIVVVRQPVGIL
jgi:hypothetical protein